MKRLLTTTAVVACMAIPALAEQHGSETSETTGQTDSMDTTTGTTGQADTGGTDAMDTDTAAETSAMPGAEIQVSTLIDKRIFMAGEPAEDGSATQNEQNDATADGDMAAGVSEIPDNWQMVGDIDDLIVTEDGEVQALLVDAGGFLGMGETERRIGIQDVRFVPDTDDEGDYYVVFAGNRATFEELGTYDQTRAEDEGWMRASQNEEMARELDQSPQRQQEPVEWGAVTTDEVLGAAVYGEDGEWIGDLSELNVTGDGEVTGVILDVGGFLGIGEKSVELPMDQVELRRTEGDEIRAYVSATQEELEAMEEWSDQS